MKTTDQVDLALKAEWKRKLASAVARQWCGRYWTWCAAAAVYLPLDFWDLHELYTVLVDADGPEGCCAGCTRLPPGWCANCDRLSGAPPEPSSSPTDQPTQASAVSNRTAPLRGQASLGGHPPGKTSTNLPSSPAALEDVTTDDAPHVDR